MYPIIGYWGFGAIVIIMLVLGKYMIIWYLDPEGVVDGLNTAKPTL